MRHVTPRVWDGLTSAPPGCAGDVLAGPVLTTGIPAGPVPFDFYEGQAKRIGWKPKDPDAAAWQDERASRIWAAVFLKPALGFRKGTGYSDEWNRQNFPPAPWKHAASGLLYLPIRAEERFSGGSPVPSWDSISSEPSSDSDLLKKASRQKPRERGPAVFDSEGRRTIPRTWEQARKAQEKLEKEAIQAARDYQAGGFQDARPASNELVRSLSDEKRAQFAVREWLRSYGVGQEAAEKVAAGFSLGRAREVAKLRETLSPTTIERPFQGFDVKPEAPPTEEPSSRRWVAAGAVGAAALLGLVLALRR